METWAGYIFFLIYILKTGLIEGAETESRSNAAILSSILTTTRPNSEGMTVPMESKNSEFHGTVLSKGILWNLESEKINPLSNVDLPNINCTEEGMFPVQDTCRQFYYCKNLTEVGLEDWYILWFTCSEEKIFDAGSQTCIPRSSVEGCPQCQKEETNDVHIMYNNHLNGKRDFQENVNRQGNAIFLPQNLSEQENEVFLQNFHHDISGDGIQIPGHDLKRQKRSTNVIGVDMIALSSKETCTDVKNIDDYVKHINSKGLHSLPSHSSGGSTNVIKEYNKILVTAKTHANSWKLDNGLLTAINETFILMKMFEPEFRKQVSAMRNNVVMISQKEKIQINERELYETKLIIQDLKAILQEISSIDDPVALTLTQMLESKSAEYRRLTELHERAQQDTEFEQLTNILKNLKTKAMEIYGKTDYARKKMEQFQQKVIEDSSKFKRNHKQTENVIQNLQRKRENNNREILRINSIKASKRNSIQTEKNRINRLNRQLEETRNDVNRENAKLSRMKKKAKDKEIAGGILLIIPVFGWIAGGILLGEGIEEQKQTVYWKQNLMRGYSDTIRWHMQTVDALNREITSAQRELSQYETETRNLQQELPRLQSLVTSFSNLQNSIDTILPFLTNAITSLEKMKQVFKDTEYELENVIDKAVKANTKAEKREVSYFMYQIEDKIRIHWKNAETKIISVGECINK